MSGPTRTHQLRSHEEHLKGDSAHTHISRCTNKSVGDRIDQLSRHSKIRDLDLTLGVEEDILGLDIYKIQNHRAVRKK